MTLSDRILLLFAQRASDKSLSDEETFSAQACHDAFAPIANAYKRANPTELISLQAGPIYALAFLMASVDDKDLSARLDILIHKLVSVRRDVLDLIAGLKKENIGVVRKKVARSNPRGLRGKGRDARAAKRKARPGRPGTPRGRAR